MCVCVCVCLCVFLSLYLAVWEERFNMLRNQFRSEYTRQELEGVHNADDFFNPSNFAALYPNETSEATTSEPPVQRRMNLYSSVSVRVTMG